MYNKRVLNSNTLLPITVQRVSSVLLYEFWSMTSQSRRPDAICVIFERTEVFHYFQAVNIHRLIGPLARLLADSRNVTWHNRRHVKTTNHLTRL